MSNRKLTRDSINNQGNKQTKLASNSLRLSEMSHKLTAKTNDMIRKIIKNEEYTKLQTYQNNHINGR